MGINSKNENLLSNSTSFQNQPKIHAKQSNKSIEEDLTINSMTTQKEAPFEEWPDTEMYSYELGTFEANGKANFSNCKEE